MNMSSRIYSKKSLTLSFMMLALFLSTLIGQVFAQGNIVIHLEIAHSYVQADQEISISEEALASGRPIVVKVKDVFGGEYDFEITVQNKKISNHFNIYYANNTKSAKADGDKIISKGELSRFESKEGVSQIDLYNLSFSDDQSAKNYQVRGQFKTEIPSWMVEDDYPAVKFTASAKSPNVKINGSGEELQDLPLDKLAELPYIKKIWGDDINAQTNFKNIPHKKFKAFFDELSTKNWSEVLQTMGIHNGFDSLDVVHNLYKTFSNYNTAIESQYPLLAKYGPFYLALIGKGPNELEPLYKQVKEINQRIKDGEDLTLDDLKVLNEASIFIAKTAIMSRHAGLFYVYADDIVKHNPDFFAKLKKRALADTGSSSNANATSPQGKDGQCPAAEESQPGDEILKLGEFGEALKKQQKEKQEMQSQIAALYAYAGMLGGNAGDDSGVGGKKGKKKSDTKEYIDSNFNFVTIAGGNNRCWMRSTWYSVLDYFKSNPEGLVHRVMEIFHNDDMPDEVSAFLGDVESLVGSERYGLDALGYYPDNVEKAIYLITKQILINEKNAYTKLHHDKLAAVEASNAEAWRTGQLQLHPAQASQHLRQAQTAKEFAEEQDVMIKDMEEGEFGGNEVMTSMYGALLGHQNKSNLLLVSTLQADVIHVGNAKKQLEKIKADTGGTYNRPVVYGNGVHFSILVPKAVIPALASSDADASGDAPTDADKDKDK